MNNSSLENEMNAELTDVSAEQLINQAFKFHLKGNIEAAEKYYQIFLDRGFSDARVNSNLGQILRAKGHLKEAELLTRQAIKMVPNFADALYNLGGILQDLGKLKDAELSYRKAIEINPNYEKAYFNLGNILKNIGKLKDAELSYHKAIQLNPNYSEAYSNLGNILRDFGKLKDAELSYHKAIQFNPNYAEAYFNLGTILRDLGKLKDAELSYRKAIEINPDFAVAFSNLGTILKDLGKLKDAELSYQKAIEINPDFAEAHSNLGSIFFDMGKLKDAELSTRKAIEINPYYANYHFNLGIILKDFGKSKEAFDSYLKAIYINPKLSNIYTLITRFLKDTDPSKLNKSKLKNMINILLERNDISHNELISTFNFIYSDEIIINLKKIDSDLSKIDLLVNQKVIINALKKITFMDIRLEKLLTNLRKNLCNKITKNKKELSNSELQLIIALGEQCFLNEYVYSLTEEEKSSLNIIINRCKNGELNEKNISILSCYYPLYRLLDQIRSLKSFISSNQSFKELMILQISEPLKEIDLSQNIKQLGAIDNKISQKVKSQYEENPYPRWRYGSHQECQKLSINQVINIEIKPNYINKNESDQQLKILIAGCGTGNQVLQAQRYKNSKITAIDLSLSSLAYAQRKINELGIDNVELIQMDILEVDLLETKFDIIECAGVLHHMDDPSKGLRVLLDILKNNGFLKLGLYSELAREDIIKARHYIAESDLNPTKTDIRRFREDVISGTYPENENLLKKSSFYSISECRDLCFHSQEHRFTINQLQKTLKSNKLEFLGFLLSEPVKSLYKQYFPEDKKQTNLQNWEKFEAKHPNTFTSMYQFWVSKI